LYNDREEMMAGDRNDNGGRAGVFMASPDPRHGYPGTKGGPGEQQQPWPGDTDEMAPRPDHGEDTYTGCGRLTGRRALITGGDSGIGRAIACAFSREGADIAFTSVPGVEADEADDTVALVEEAGRRGFDIPADLTQRTECVRVVDTAVAKLGGIDVLVNNAAYQQEQNDFLELDPEQIERTFRTNILACMYVAQAAIPHMKPGGVILNTGSVTALQGNRGLVDYAATKGAIHTFTKSLAQALADRGIRVNCVAPGPVWTPLIPSTLEPDHVAEFGADTLWKRPAQPIEIATTFVFLASDEGRYYSGEILSPTGRVSSR
jgi:NAD(P)-dependent dehydrogenase (short-subunit alcohol dehydrogenase family)